MPREDKHWTLDTLGYIVGVNNEDEFKNLHHPSTNAFISTVELSTVEGIASGAVHLDKDPSDDLLFEAFVYYYRNDAFLPEIGYVDPFEQLQQRADREFLGRLGDERADVRCQTEGCAHGAIQSSALCKKHHFEMIKKRPYPFDC
ncbi:MAG TPA: hypothetical protein V6D22_10745 [Candidatus Obscuribacterales bacterium]